MQYICKIYKHPDSITFTEAEKRTIESYTTSGMVQNSDAYIIEVLDNDTYSILCHLGENTDILEVVQETAAQCVRKVQEKTAQLDGDIDIVLVCDNEISQNERYSIEKGMLLARFPGSVFQNKPHVPHYTIQGIQNEELYVISDAIQFTRRLGYTPANIMNNDTIVDEIKSLGNLPHVKVKVLRDKGLQKENMHMHLAVNQGSDKEAAMGILEYAPKGTQNDAPIVLVGKGVMYDNGGMYMKPEPMMNEMIGDMNGAGTVLGVLYALAASGVQKRVVAVCGIAENLVDAKSYKNGDILTARNGKTVEVKHSDAEGRLVLADVLSYACDTYNPALVLDVATLTGACMIALGEMYAGVFSDNKDISKLLMDIGDDTNDWAWHMPVDHLTKDAVKGKRSDLINTAQWDRVMGASTAASFLANFVHDTQKWAHVDIAGVALRTKAVRSYDVPNMTASGAMVHTLYEYIKQYKHEG